MSPLIGSTTPGVPSTTRRTRSQDAPPWLAASMTAEWTSRTGSSVSWVEISLRPVVAPVMSAQAATTRSGPTSTPITYALRGTTA